MLVGKQISNKIDYEKLKDLSFIFGPTLSSANSTQTSEVPPVTEPKIESSPVVSTRSR